VTFLVVSPKDIFIHHSLSLPWWKKVAKLEPNWLCKGLKHWMKVGECKHIPKWIRSVWESKQGQTLCKLGLIYIFGNNLKNTIIKISYPQTNIYSISCMAIWKVKKSNYQTIYPKIWISFDPNPWVGVTNCTLGKMVNLLSLGLGESYDFMWAHCLFMHHFDFKLCTNHPLSFVWTIDMLERSTWKLVLVPC